MFLDVFRTFASSELRCVALPVTQLGSISQDNSRTTPQKLINGTSSVHRPTLETPTFKNIQNKEARSAFFDDDKPRL